MVDSDRFKLFVGGLSRETSDVALREHFSKYGEVVECVVAEDRDTGTRRGFGFVTFSDSAAFDQALDECHVILQRRVDVKKAIPRSEQLRNQHQSKSLSRNGFNNNYMTSNNDQFRTKKIFVGGLPPTLTENEFKCYFQQFGSITDVVVMQDNLTNRSRGFGFITFDSEESVMEVTRKCFHELGGKFVEVKRAVPKDEATANSSHSSRIENGISSFTGQQFGYSIPYPVAYRPIMGTLGYSYVPPIPFCPSFPIGGFYGVGYDLARVSPPISPFPFGSVSTFYPAYMNGGVGVLSTTPNGVMYSGFANSGVYKNLGEFGNGGLLNANTNIPSVQITEIDSNGVSSGV